MRGRTRTRTCTRRAPGLTLVGRPPRKDAPTLRILGIDPGSRVAGYGLVDILEGRIVAVAAGVWRLDGRREMHERLARLSLEFSRVVDAYCPAALCLEMAFVAVNVRSAMSLGLARGVILSQASLRGLAVHEMTASAAKKAVVGGGADKEHVALALEGVLGVRFEGMPLDASDALAIAYAHALRELERLRLGASAHPALSKERACSASAFGPKSKASKGKRQGFEILLPASARSPKG
jgi:crossover junction endodeoxyribonuclease RuvC